MKINNYLEFINEASNHDFGCVMLNIPFKNWNEITSMVNKDDLYEVEGDNYGINNDPHITLLNGLHSIVTLHDITKCLKGFDLSVLKLEIKSIDLFENDKYDVVKFSIKKDKLLQSIFDKLSSLPNSNEFKDYKPHITIAYVKKGLGKKYIDPNYKLEITDIGSVVYSDSNNKVTKIAI